MSKLFEPITIGDISLKNRIIMSPMTRTRANGVGRVPNELMKEYYVQRASAGLIISEATSVSPMGVGYPDTPGIWSDEQTEGWKKIVEAVHNAGGKMVLQLWHVGRVSDPIYHNGDLPIAPSAIALSGNVNVLRPERPYVTPRALLTEEIPQIVEQFRKGAENAKKAGFDGVELHAANGYLIDQFLNDRSNKRTDIYGGSPENRARFLLEITDVVCSVWTSKRVGVHLSPRCDAHDMGDSSPEKTFGYVVEELSKRNIAFICSREYYNERDWLGAKLKTAFTGAYIVNEGFTFELANKILDDGNADAVAFGKLFISNPDLPYRFQNNKELTAGKEDLFFASGKEGYTNYEFTNNLK
ncbi:alkene reductase [Sphingobacterium sp. 18053]|uniref:alkene reductase n=1 Tax=Sphingobacterium sp. 18053 TaxID=2681401 RepID=UPI0013590AF7|nr:alkene reductase [Sphingobacterium sp. 18053]